MSHQSLRNSFRWPKVRPALSDAQRVISNDFMQYWHERLAGTPAFGPIEHFNHGYAVRHRPTRFLRTLEIGAGLGEHLRYELLTPEQRAEYVALELRANMIEELRQRYPDIRSLQADCQERLDFPDHHFDRILAIHVLEHLTDLPATVAEMHRLCAPGGTFSVVIPCEGGFLYGLARRISAQRLFEKRYNMAYDWFIEQEHLSVPAEILDVVERHFQVVHRAFFPFFVPVVTLNLCIGLTLRPL